MKIEVKGAIISDSEQWVYDWFEIPATSAGKVNKLLNQALPNEDIEISINSPGGSVFAGSEIFTALKEYKGKVVGKIVGMAGSAASVIAMGCSELQISPTGQIMIHNASGSFEGDYNDMQLGADILKGINESIANAYAMKTGKDQKCLLEMMNNETWMSSQKAFDLGFVDKIMFVENHAVTNTTIDKNGLLPREVIEKMRNEFKGKIENSVIKNADNPATEIEIAKAKLLLQTII